MKNIFRITPLAVALLIGSAASTPAYALCDGCVVGAIGTSTVTLTGAIAATTASVSAMNLSVSQLLYQVGTATTQGASKVANTIETAARVQREFDANQERSRRYENARQNYYVPNSICSESGSGGFNEVRAGVAAVKASIRTGGGGKAASTKINQALTAPAQPPSIDAMRSASIHADYCDTDDYAAYGGATACPAVSTTMPGADKRLDSLTIGAGKDGKDQDLTFTQAQTDAARMYTQNSARRSVAPQLKKGQAESDAGVQYIGLMNQYNSIISAATDPQDQMIAASQPLDSTKDLLKEARSSKSAESYYQKIASAEAKRTGTMSAREFEYFEVGRRYANTEYQADLQNMTGDNLVREQIRVQTQTNWLLLELRNDVTRGNIINGLNLASSARQEFEPVLGEKYRAVNGRMGGAN